MPSQVDLEDLEPDEEEKKKRARPKTKRAASTADRDLRNRLTDVFERIAASLEARGDEELAEVIRDDAVIMSQGLVSLTRPFAALRTVILTIASIIEPVLAFGRVLRVLALRWSDRRAARAQEPETESYTP